MSTVHYLLVAAIFATSVFFSFFFTPKANEIAYRIGEGAVDIPKDGRRMHKNSIARLGGLAIVAAFLISTIFFILFTRFLQLTPVIIGMLIGGCTIGVLGFLDDIYNLRARFKLVIQIFAAIIATSFGVKIDLSTIFGQLIKNSTAEEIISIIITIIWLVAITNAMNLIDGLDGLASGIAVFSTLTVMIIMMLVMNVEMALLAAALAGATIGFMPFNKNPAVIFMGDTGATFLGFMIACISVQGLYRATMVVSLAVPFFVLAVPIFDTAYAFIRRIMDGRSPFEPDRLHIHHKLVDYGLSHKQAVLTLYFITIAFSLSSIALTAFNATTSALIIVSIFLAVFILLWIFTTIKPIKKMLRYNRIKTSKKNSHKG